MPGSRRLIGLRALRSTSGETRPGDDRSREHDGGGAQSQSRPADHSGPCRQPGPESSPYHGKHGQSGVPPHGRPVRGEHVGHERAAADAVDSGQDEEPEGQGVQGDTVGACSEQESEDGPAARSEDDRQPVGARSSVEPRSDERRKHGERRHGERQIQADLVACLADRDGEEEGVGEGNGHHAVAGGMKDLHLGQPAEGVHPASASALSPPPGLRRCPSEPHLPMLRALTRRATFPGPWLHEG